MFGVKQKRWECECFLNDPPLERQGSNYPLHSLDKLMEADIITLHVPLTRTGPDATYHFFDEKRIRKMKRGAILFNTSRGECRGNRSIETHIT